MSDTFLLARRLGRILTGMKYLYLLAVPLVLVISAYFIVKWNSTTNIADMWSRDTQAKNTQRDGGKVSDMPAASLDMLKLRQTHKLRPLTEQEDGKHIQDLPKGVFGFSMCSVNSLSARRGNTSSLEIHKHYDGIVYYVGYASDEDIEKYVTRQKHFHILTSPHSAEKGSTLFEIPVEFVSKCEERPLKDGYLFDLYVTAIPELQS